MEILPSRADWYVACESSGLGEVPQSVEIFDTPLVLFRSESGDVSALLDNCPHRGAPLSIGKVNSGQIECAYHGWTFSGTGVCVHIPGLVDRGPTERYSAVAFPAFEQDGYVWVCGSSARRPAHLPPRVPLYGEPGYTTIREVVDLEASVFDVAENALDVPHTAFLHGGIFRSPKRISNPRRVVITRGSDSVEAEYFDEQGLPPFITEFLTKGAAIQHIDRFILPSTLQVEYGFGPRNHILVTSNCTPLSNHKTRLFANISLRSSLPHSLLKLALRPLLLRIIRQDAVMLQAQTANMARMRERSFMSSEIDILSPHIRSLMLAHGQGRELRRDARKVKALKLGL